MNVPSLPRVAVAVPAYNESDGIGELLAEIDATLGPATETLRLVVVDDASTDGTAAVVRAVADKLDCDVDLIERGSNGGHGAALIQAYRKALETGPDVVLQIDGDGQFLGGDLRRVLVLIGDGAPAACGVRRFRQDPWFRMVLTRLLRGYVRFAFGVPTRDANCPLRGYDREVLGSLIDAVPPDAVVPNLYLTVLAARRGVTMVEVDVSHRVRRGRVAQGSTWSGRNPLVTSWKLLAFSIKALQESWRFRHSLAAP